MKWLALIFVPFLITACGINKPPTADNNKQEQQDRERLLKTYGAIQGLYEGEIETPRNQKIPIQFSLTYVEIPNGKNQDGETRLLPVLRARYIRLDTAEIQNLEARFIDEQGELTLTSKTDASGRIDGTGEFVYIRGQLNGDLYTAEVRNNVGVLGKLNSRLLTRDLSSGSGGEREDRFKRLKEMYMELAGEWIGAISATATSPDFQVRLRFTVTEKQVGNDFIPVVLGTYTLLQNGQEFSRPTSVNVGYRPDTRELILDTSTSGDSFNFAGKFENNKITGTVRFPKFESPFVGTKPVQP